MQVPKTVIPVSIIRPSPDGTMTPAASAPVTASPGNEKTLTKAQEWIDWLMLRRHRPGSGPPPPATDITYTQPGGYMPVPQYPSYQQQQQQPAIPDTFQQFRQFQEFQRQQQFQQRQQALPNPQSPVYYQPPPPPPQAYQPPPPPPQAYQPPPPPPQAYQPPPPPPQAYQPPQQAYPPVPQPQYQQPPPQPGVPSAPGASVLPWYGYTLPPPVPAPRTS